MQAVRHIVPILPPKHHKPLLCFHALFNILASPGPVHLPSSPLYAGSAVLISDNLVQQVVQLLSSRNDTLQMPFRLCYCSQDTTWEFAERVLYRCKACVMQVRAHPPTNLPTAVFPSCSVHLVWYPIRRSQHSGQSDSDAASEWTKRADSCLDCSLSS